MGFFAQVIQDARPRASRRLAASGISPALPNQRERVPGMRDPISGETAFAAPHNSAFADTGDSQSPESNAARQNMRQNTHQNTHEPVTPTAVAVTATASTPVTESPAAAGASSSTVIDLMKLVQPDPALDQSTQDSNTEPQPDQPLSAVDAEIAATLASAAIAPNSSAAVSESSVSTPSAPTASAGAVKPVATDLVPTESIKDSNTESLPAVDAKQATASATSTLPALLAPPAAPENSTAEPARSDSDPGKPMQDSNTEPQSDQPLPVVDAKITTTKITTTRTPDAAESSGPVSQPSAAAQSASAALPDPGRTKPAQTVSALTEVSRATSTTPQQAQPLRTSDTQQFSASEIATSPASPTASATAGDGRREQAHIARPTPVQSVQPRQSDSKTDASARTSDNPSARIAPVKATSTPGQNIVAPTSRAAAQPISNAGTASEHKTRLRSDSNTNAAAAPPNVAVVPQIVAPPQVGGLAQIASRPIPASSPRNEPVLQIGQIDVIVETPPLPAPIVARARAAGAGASPSDLASRHYLRRL